MEERGKEMEETLSLLKKFPLVIYSPREVIVVVSWLCVLCGIMYLSNLGVFAFDIIEILGTCQNIYLGLWWTTKWKSKRLAASTHFAIPCRTYTTNFSSWRRQTASYLSCIPMVYYWSLYAINIRLSYGRTRTLGGRRTTLSIITRTIPNQVIYRHIIDYHNNIIHASPTIY